EALTGLFFGMEYELLLAHRLAGGTFDAMRPRAEGDPEVLDTIGRNRWWRASTVEPDARTGSTPRFRSRPGNGANGARNGYLPKSRTRQRTAIAHCDSSISSGP
ncbi:MAG: hypothetical protein WD995_05090, partial [Gemmatimonadota bacterium]